MANGDIMFDVDHRCRRGTGGGGALRATTCVRSEAPPEFGARARGSSRGELVRVCGRRVEVGVAGVAPVVCAVSPDVSPRPRLDRPSRLGREPLRTQPGRLRPGDDGRGCGARSSPVLGLAPARGTAHTAPGGLDPRLWGLDDGRALPRRSPPRRSRGSPSPAQPPRRFAWACGRGYPRLTGC